MFPSAVPLSHEGRFAIVTDVESGMRWTSWRRARLPCGRTAPEADDEIVWSWHPLAGAKSAG